MSLLNKDHVQFAGTLHTDGELPLDIRRAAGSAHQRCVTRAITGDFSKQVCCIIKAGQKLVKGTKHDEAVRHQADTAAIQFVFLQQNATAFDDCCPSRGEPPWLVAREFR